ncbi:predicted protein [Naegleria gruberi]|uniref:Predicted protein n=1 Tax=Naegleria gruberi TaxID=5762 RepID=D2VKL2_NAEGR|nr:uncharacterized protein NAEGRDRAFT_80324 [Naegleria gruberi]EFC42710.1 predicted protein [Naegleria gruberi]|eukprot:XP_002675454.1 predicted protein [Naegleria gruberi strain NEG-M]
MNQSAKVTKTATAAVSTTNAANASTTTVNLANSSIAMTISSSANMSGILTSKSTNDMNTSSGQLAVNNEEGAVSTSAATRTQYVQAPSVKTFIKSHQYHFLDLTEEQRAQIEELERKMEREKQQNNIEYERNIGKEILYGQPIQLMHLKTKKYLCVNPREKAEKQKDCLKLTLVSEEAIDSTSHVIVLPYYKFRSEGDAVKLSDQVRFFNRKSNTFLHLGQFTYSTVLSSNNQLISTSTQVSLDEDDRREINMIPGTTFTSSFSYTNWRIRLFSPYLSIHSGNMLKAGDVIRLFHTELNSFLSVNSKTGRVECVGSANKTSSSTADKALLPIKSNKKSTDDDTSQSKNDKMYAFTDSLWEVEMVDPTRGGALMWNKKYRFKHVSSGKYLYASKDSHFVEENEDIFDDFSSDSDDEFGITNSFFSKLSRRTTANTEDFDRSSVASASQVNISVFNESSISLSSTTSSPGNSATDQYWKLLKRKLLAAVKKEQIGVSLELAVKDGLGSDDTTFIICQHDVQSRHDNHHNTAPIPLQSYFRLKHAHSQTWVHGVSSDSGIGSSLMKADDTPLKGKNETTPSTPSSTTTNKPTLNLRKQALTQNNAANAGMIKPEKKSSRKKFRLYATNVLYEQDVFSVYKVPQQELEDLLLVQSIYPLIESFMRRVQSRSIKRPDDFKVLLQTLLPALAQLVCFLTDSDEEDPLKREGIPFKSRQNILRERGVIDLVMRLIEELVDNVPDIVSLSVFGESPAKLGDENTWTESDLASYHYLLRNLYRVIKQSVKLNSDNGLYMSKYITEIQQHIKMDVGASVALIEILTNNYGLLNRMPKEQIRYFVRLLVDEESGGFDENLTSPRKLMVTPRGFSSSPAKKMTPKKEESSEETATEYLSAKNSIYLSFLSALCACGNRPIKKNQSYITELLFEDEKVTNSLMFPYFVDNDPKNKLCIKVNGTEYGLLEFVSKAMSQALSANTANFDGQDDFLILLNFFQKQIELLSLLCLGRNKEAIQYIQNKFSYELILACIKEKNLPFEIRSSFCTLLLNCFLDVDPYEANPTISFTRKWTEIEKMKKTQDDKKIKELRTFLTDFYKENYQLDCGNDITSVQKNLFIYNLVFMTKKMFELGMFDLSNIYPTHRVVVELLKLLDCTNDKLNGKPALDAIYEENEQTMITTRIKQEVCEIFDIIKSQQLNVRVDFFLINFKYSFTVSDKSEDKRQDFVKNSLFKDSIFNESASVQNLTKILIDLTKCKNASLAVKALNLLIRIHREKEELKDLLPRIELLVSSAVMKSYDNILEILKDLKNFINAANSSSGTSLEQYSKSIQQSFKRVEDDYEKNGSRTQRILRNLSAHELAIETLTMSFDDNRSQQRIHKACVRFLSDFVRKNAENQTILFPYLEFFMSKIGQDLGMSTLICEVVRNNRGLCSMLEERHIRYLIDLIAEHGLKARYLNFLKIILMGTDGNPIKRNQTLVTQNLLDRKKDVIVLFNDEEGIKERDRRIKNKEHETQPDGILCYHIELLSLLAECGDGRNHVAEVKLQSLLSIEDILKQLLSPNTIPELRNPLLRFLDEVYINADKVQDEKQMSSSSPIFRLLAKMARELDMFVNSGGNSNNRRSTEIILTDPLDARSVATPIGVGVHPRNTSSQDSNPLELAKTSFVLRLKKPLEGQGDDSLMGHDPEEKLYVEIKYIFQLMIPFIHHYFHLKFPPNDFTGEPQQLEVIKAVIENLFNLYQTVAEAAHKEAVIKCLQAMCKVSKSGNQSKSMPQEFTQEIFKFLKEASSTKATQFKQHMQKQQNKQLVLAQKKEDEDEKYMKQYKVYVSGFTTILTQESNFANLGILLYEQYRGYLDMIVNVIRRISELAPSSKDGEIIGKAGSISNLALYSIEMLKQIMNTQQDESVLEKLNAEQRQRKLNKFHHDLAKAKIPELVLEMVCSEDHKIMKSSIELGVSMLFEGNNIVQGYIYSLFKKGSTERFFLSIRDRIRLSIDEIKERKAYYKRQQEKKQDFKQYRAKKLRRGDNPGTVPATPTAQSSSSNQTDDNEKENEETFQEEFEEKGHIEEILRFLQLMTEGHNNDLQHYLAEQKYNTQSFNIVEECLNFIVALEKDITADNIETAIQCFDSLTEFVQGPCLTTQQVIGMSPKFYFVCNEIMSKDYKGVFKLDKCLELKGAMFICLTSLLEGSNNHKIAMIMRDSLNFPDIMEFLKKCCVISFTPTQFIDESRGKGLPKIDLNIGAKEEMTSRIQAEVTQDGFRDSFRDKQLTKEKQKRICEATEQYEEIAFQIYFLLNTLSDGENIFVNDSQSSSKSTFSENSNKKISHLLEVPEYSRYLVPVEKETGRMEIVRNNTIENVYYRIPNESSFLSEKSRKNFLTSVNSEEYTAQEKIRNFFDQTDTFYTEIVHYKQFESDRNQKVLSSNFIVSFLWRFLREDNWSKIKLLSFLLSLIINCFVLFGFKKMYAVTPGDIPLPGYSDPDDSTTGSFQYQGDWKTDWLDYVQTVLGVIQLVTTSLLFGTYLYFFATLEVKKKFKLKMGEKWEDLPRDRQFYKNYLKYLAKDFYVSFLVVYWVVSVLGLTVNPIVYAIHLFEVVVRFDTLYDIVLSIQTTAERFVLTSMLMIVAIWFFSLMIFAFVPETFYLKSDNSDKQFLCDSAADCMLNTLNYGLRTGGFFEDQFTPSWGIWTREIINMLFILVVIVVLFEVVFGIILESFAELRENREKTEDRLKNKCFICDIERARFDQKANEGITFNNHVRKEHNMWNYLFFLIHLNRKPKTEYTGSEQYVSNCVHEQDVSFFPILRSITLENVEYRARLREESSNSTQQGGSQKQSQSAK